MPIRSHTLPIVDPATAGAMATAMGTRTARKVLLVINGKGGVGKSSLSANLAVALAAARKRVLLVEMDPQGNHGEDLGYIRDTSIYDSGKSQVDAVLSSTALEPTGEARPGLYVVPGGEHLDYVIEELYCQQRVAAETGDTSWMYMYAACIAQAADAYDLVILDVAPGSVVLQTQALVAADMVIVPSRSDLSSRKGLRMVARRFRDARPFNPRIHLLGMVLFATGSRATRVQEKIRGELAADVQDAAPVFITSIRHVEAAAAACRTRGRVARELAADPTLDPSLKRSMEGLAADYFGLTKEILTEIGVLVAEDNKS